MRLIDIGVNLCDDMFKGSYNGKEAHASDIQKVIERAIEQNVDKMMITGTCLEDIKEAVQLIRDLGEVFPSRLYTTVGVHPTRCMEFVESGNDEAHREQLLKIIEENKDIVVVSIFKYQYINLNINILQFKYIEL